MSDFDPGSFRELEEVPPLPGQELEEQPLFIELEDEKDRFQPGEAVRGMARWELGGDPTEVVLRLFWFTEGRGTRDVEVVHQKIFEAPAREDRRAFEFRLPEGPYSFSGTLISLIWALELVADPGDRTTRRMLTVGPDGREIQLGSAEPEDAETGEEAGDGEGDPYAG